MEKQRVFIPIHVKDELPEMDKKVIVFGEQLSSNPQMGGKYPFVTKRQDLSRSSVQPDRMQDDNKFMYARYVSDWLKEQEGYFFTIDELENFSIGLVERMADEISKESASFSSEKVYKEYVETLNKK